MQKPDAPPAAGRLPGSVESQAGSADCIAVYDRALTGDEVAALLAGDGCASDSDGDGVEDGDDLFPNSNSEATVVINGCDSGVENKFVAKGANLNDLIGAVMSKKHGDFVKQVTKMAKQWKKGGLITGMEKGKITSCA